MTNTAKIIKDITKVIDDKKGTDIVIIDISELSSFADYFINTTAGNIRQLETIADEVHKKLLESNMDVKNIEGKASSGWILLDAGDIIINIFGKDERDKYQIEKIWSDGKISEYSTEA